MTAYNFAQNARFWLMKTEPGECGIDDFLKAPDRTLSWFGVRNYQARNMIRDEMHAGDGVLFYHSSCREPGIVGLAEVASESYPDRTQFDPSNPYFDPKSSKEAPRWFAVDVRVVAPCGLISIQTLRNDPELARLIILKRGNRLSVTPVAPEDFERIRTQHMHF